MLIRFRSLTAQSEATLTPIGQEFGCSVDPLIGLRTHDAVMLQTNTMNSVLQSLLVAFQSHLYAINELSLT